MRPRPLLTACSFHLISFIHTTTLASPSFSFGFSSFRFFQCGESSEDKERERERRVGTIPCNTPSLSCPHPPANAHVAKYNALWF